MIVKQLRMFAEALGSCVLFNSLVSLMVPQQMTLFEQSNTLMAACPLWEP